MSFYAGRVGRCHPVCVYTCVCFWCLCVEKQGTQKHLSACVSVYFWEHVCVSMRSRSVYLYVLSVHRHYLCQQLPRVQF